MLTIDYDRLGLEAGDVLLDLACGEGRHSRPLRGMPRIHGVALDLGQQEVDKTAASLQAMDESDDPVYGAADDAGEWLVVRGNSYHLPFPDASFDCIIAAEVLEHLHRDDEALAEIERVLKPDGVLAVSVPRFWPEAVCWTLSEQYRDSPGGHVRIYAPGELPVKLARAGFRVFDSHFAHGLHSPYWWLKCWFGVDAEPNWIVSAYHKLLVWEMFDKPLALRLAASVLDPLAGKSEVFYARKA